MSDGEPRISMGRDPRYRLIHIDEAQELANYYRCPVCEEFLQVRHGEVRIWHFAHVKAESESPNCTLRTESGWTRWLEEQRFSPVERKERSRTMRVEIRINQYTEEAKLVGLLPTLTWDEISDWTRVDEILSGIRVTTKGIRGTVEGKAFHPSNPEVVVELNPDSTEYSVKIESGPRHKSVIGTWRAEPIDQNNVFVGSWIQAERADRGLRTSEGDVVFVVSNCWNSIVLKNSKEVRVGSHRLLALEVRRETRTYLDEILPGLGQVIPTFSISVIIPSVADPRAAGPIEGRPGDSVLIGIHPPSGLSPQFEIVAVPMEREKAITLPIPHAPGETIFFSTSFPPRGSRRISIHWGGTHRLIHLYSTQESSETGFGVEPSIGLVVESPILGEVSAVPWMDGQTLPIRVVNDTFPSVRVNGPSDLRIDLRAEWVDVGDKQLCGHENCILSSRVESFVHSWLMEGCSTVVVDFDTLGSVQLVNETSIHEEPLHDEPTHEPPICEESIDEELICEIHKMSIEEIESRILDLHPDLPKRASWKLLREICGLSSGTPHHVVRGIRLCDIRRALISLRNRNDDN